jgi:hypothetical protein
MGRMQRRVLRVVMSLCSRRLIGLAESVSACVGLVFVCCSAHSLAMKRGGVVLRYTFLYFGPSGGVLFMPGTEFRSASV